MTEAHTEKEGSSAMDMPRVSDTMLPPSTIEYNIIADQKFGRDGWFDGTHVTQLSPRLIYGEKEPSKGAKRMAENNDPIATP